MTESGLCKMLRYFRTTPETLDSIRATLDAEWGFPNPETKTATSLEPAATSPRDAQGRVYAVISAVYCDFVLPSQMLPQLLASGAVEEIDEATYQAAVQPQLP